MIFPSFSSLIKSRHNVEVEQYINASNWKVEMIFRLDKMSIILDIRSKDTIVPPPNLNKFERL